MNSVWKCDHRRSQGFAGYPHSELFELVAGRLITVEELSEELRQRGLPCPACRAQNRRIRRAWLWVGIAAVVVLLIGWRLQ